jgi:hypothetical protein
MREQEAMPQIGLRELSHHPPTTQDWPDQILGDRPEINLSDIAVSLREDERY